MFESLIQNPYAGEILKHEFLAELGMSQNALARAINVPPNRIHAIINGSRRITADTDLRLCRYFGLSEGYFLRLQNSYELMQAKRNLGEKLQNIIPYTPNSEPRKMGYWRGKVTMNEDFDTCLDSVINNFIGEKE